MPAFERCAVLGCWCALTLRAAAAEAAIDFKTEIQPLLETACVSCHCSAQPDGGLNLETLDAALAGGDQGPSIVVGRPDESLLYTLTILEKDDDALMPPTNSGGPLPKEKSDVLRRWIAEGAVWPDGVTLRARESSEGLPESPDNMELVKKIHALIEEQQRRTTDEKPADYSAVVPRTNAAYHMVAIEGGRFLMGSPADEADRQEDEGSQCEVQVDPFWIGRYEVTWDEYEPFMITQVDRRKDGARIDYDPAVHTVVDAVSQPTPPYVEMSFGMGQKGYPAISMTQHAANKYCQWLSAQTGHFYRLPTEAEWEYACRAGTDTAYSFGEDPTDIDEYAWYYDNSEGKYQKVGKKKPNPWGLHDMHGNVMEWTADQFEADYFHRIKDSRVNPFIRPDRLYPRTVRGGGWDDDPERLRSASRRGSTPDWKLQDPQLPKSIWYHTDAQWLGFRIVRPVELPTPEEMYFFWNSAAGKR